MKPEMKAMVAAAALQLCPMEEARLRFHQAVADHLSHPPNLKRLRQLEERQRLLDRRRIRKAVRRSTSAR